ncbi:hypothetical protein AwDysgo_00440 [Bacteroidales bacterium]|nr:hypothetical protein AwDysgo_00440 [Bacteroidales bacterium]
MPPLSFVLSEGHISVRFTSPARGEIALYNMQAQKQTTTMLYDQTETSISTAHLSAGTYILWYYDKASKYGQKRLF